MSDHWFKIQKPSRSECWEITTPSGPVLIDAKIKLQTVTATAEHLRQQYERKLQTLSNNQTTP
jgi:hypothetical protein